MPRSLRMLFFAAVSLAVSATDTAAQTRSEIDNQRVDWSYASTFGTGIYTIGNRTVTVLRMPLSLRWRTPDDDGRWGIRLKLPITVGYYDVPNDLGDLFSNNFATVSALPGIEFEKRITPRWTVKPTVSYGVGQDLNTGSRSALHEIGVRSVYRIPVREGEVSITNAFLYSGSSPRDGERQNFGVLATGMHFIFPIGEVYLGGPANAGVHFIHYLFFDRLDFAVNQDTRSRITQQYEIAVTLGTYQAISFYGIELDRIGIGVQGGEGLLALRLVSGFIF